ncbi:MAG: hypothetical protein HOF72_14285 [Planctomycetaceae bacterium]|nr:hypothetical protein [Planctomycetaceae bacterium]
METANHADVPRSLTTGTPLISQNIAKTNEQPNRPGDKALAGGITSQQTTFATTWPF